MAASQTRSGLSATKFRASRLGATGRSWRLPVVRGVRRRPRRAESPISRISRATRRRDAPARMPPALPAQLGVDPRRPVGPAPGGEDAADPPAQLGLRLGTVLGGGDRAQPGVEP